MLKGPFSHESAQMICAENQESMSQLDTFLDGFRRPGGGGGSEGVEVGGGEGVPSLKEINYSLWLILSHFVFKNVCFWRQND